MAQGQRLGLQCAASRILPAMARTASPLLAARRPRPLVLIAVLSLHALVLGSLLQLTAWRDRKPGALAQAPVLVRLLRPALPPAPAAAALAPSAEPRAPPRVVAADAPRTPATDGPRPTLPQAISAAPAPQLPVAAAAPDAQPPRPALKLELPRSASAPWRQRNAALDDPRANTAPATVESRLAAAMGGEAGWVQERLDNDRVRWRRGSECIEMQRSRAGQLGLAGGAFRDLWAAKNC